MAAPRLVDDADRDTAGFPVVGRMGGSPPLLLDSAWASD
jgi:hypothetical protein